MAAAFWVNYFERLGAVALILVALYFLARKLRATRLFSHSSRRLNVVESLLLSPQATLHIVKTGSRYFLIGSANGSVTRIAELDDGEDC